MSDKKVKVENTRKNKITINLVPFNGKEIPVNGEGFALLTEEELAYVMNSSKVFEVGRLRLAKNQELEGIEVPTSPNGVGDAEIATMLKKPQKQIEKAINEITDLHVMKDVLAKAKQLDKSNSVIEVIEKRLDEIMRA